MRTRSLLNYYITVDTMHVYLLVILILMSILIVTHRYSACTGVTNKYILHTSGPIIIVLHVYT